MRAVAAPPRWAVSQNCILRGSRIFQSVGNQRRLADYKSAIRQIENLRYACGPATRWVYWWNSTETIPSAVDTSKVSIQLNTDFNTKGMSSDELTAVVSAWQAGAISRETMFDILRRGEVLFDGPTSEQEGRVISAGASAEKNDQQKG